jgi:hypothetical protein
MIVIKQYTKYYKWSMLSALCAGPALAHGDKLGDIGAVLGGPLWTALGLGVVLFLAYGVSWLVSQPVLRRGHDEVSLETMRLHNSRLQAALEQVGEGVLVVDGAHRLQLVSGHMWQGESAPLVGQCLDEVVCGGELAALVEGVTANGEEKVAICHMADGAEMEVVARQLRDVGGMSVALYLRVMSAQRHFVVGNLRIEWLQKLAYCDGRRLDLTLTEFRLLAYLAERPGQSVGREELLRGVWGHALVARSRTVDTHIRRLRAKMGEDGAMVQTVRGKGYCLVV